jgi:hypothetical protein
MVRAYCAKDLGGDEQDENAKHRGNAGTLCPSQEIHPRLIFK